MNRFAQSSQLLVLLLLVALGVLPLRAQKWIAPTPEELSMTEQKGAPSADAVFLFHEEITDDDNLTFTYLHRPSDGGPRARRPLRSEERRVRTEPRSRG